MKYPLELSDPAGISRQSTHPPSPRPIPTYPCGGRNCLPSVNQTEANEKELELFHNSLVKKLAGVRLIDGRAAANPDTGLDSTGNYVGNGSRLKSVKNVRNAKAGTEAGAWVSFVADLPLRPSGYYKHKNRSIEGGRRFILSDGDYPLLIPANSQKGWRPNMSLDQDATADIDSSYPDTANGIDCHTLHPVDEIEGATDEALTLDEVLRDIKEMSMQAFGDNILTKCVKAASWKIAALLLHKTTSPVQLNLTTPVSSSTTTLCSSYWWRYCKTCMGGFVCYRSRPDVVGRGWKCLEVAKVCVKEEMRGHGLGRYLLREMVKLAKEMPDVGIITLSSLPEVTGFYKRLGFKAYEDVGLPRPSTRQEAVPIYGEEFGPMKKKLAEDHPPLAQLDSDDELVEGQVYMEYFIRRMGKTSRGKKRA